MTILVALGNIFIIILVVVFWILAFAILYHLFRFGVGTLPKRLSIIFLVGMLALSFIIVFSYSRLNLNQLIS